MTERSKRFLYILYALAEHTYYQQANTMKEDIGPSKVWGAEPSIVVNDEDNGGDQWTMFKKDYNMIREIMEVYDDNTDWATIEIDEDNPYVTIVEVKDENT